MYSKLFELSQLCSYSRPTFSGSSLTFTPFGCFWGSKRPEMGNCDSKNPYGPPNLATLFVIRCSLRDCLVGRCETHSCSLATAYGTFSVLAQRLASPFDDKPPIDVSVELSRIGGAKCDLGVVWSLPDGFITCYRNGVATSGF